MHNYFLSFLPSNDFSISYSNYKDSSSFPLEEVPLILENISMTNNLRDTILTAEIPFTLTSPTYTYEYTQAGLMIY